MKLSLLSATLWRFYYVRIGGVGNLRCRVRLICVLDISSGNGLQLSVIFVTIYINTFRKGKLYLIIEKRVYFHKPPENIIPLGILLGQFSREA